MRILQLHTRYRNRGGEDAVVDAEYDILRRAGHDVRQYVVENPSGSSAAAVSLAGSVWNPVSRRRVLEVIATARPDVAHVHNTWFALSPSVLTVLRRERVPVVATVHNYRLACVNALFLRDGAPCEACLDRSLLEGVRHGCYRGSRITSAVGSAGIAIHRGLGTWTRSVDRFVVLSRFARERLVRAGLPADRMVLGSNFVADPGPREGPPSASREILFVGRVSREKGLHVLLEAWRVAAPVGLRLVVVGDGPDLDALRRTAPQGVTFAGRLPAGDVVRRLRRARALVIPSIWYEGQPVTALEGLAAGVPLLVSDIGGMPEILGDTGAGWTAPPSRPDALGSALHRLRDDDAVDVAGRRARDHYVDAFAPTAALRRLETLYRSVGRRPAQ